MLLGRETCLLEPDSPRFRPAHKFLLSSKPRYRIGSFEPNESNVSGYHAAGQVGKIDLFF